LIASAVPAVSDVKAQCLNAWGKVMISYKVQGDIDERATLVVSAKNNVTGERYLVSKKYLSGDIGANEGFHRIVWDMEKQGVSVNSENVVFTVAYYSPYLVIDLSSGKNSKSYPVLKLYSTPSGGWTDEYKTTKLVLRLIEPGSFKMGGSYDVTLTKPYYIGVFEVTQKQYELVTDNTPSRCDGNTLPVENVSWDTIRGDSYTYNWPRVKTVDSNSFIGRIQSRTGLNFDLPTEAQWEYACRSGTSTTSYWGELIVDFDDYVWYWENSDKETHAVGTKKENAWGLYDMIGNVSEWCLDWFYDLPSWGSDPMGPLSGTKRVRRGASLNHYWSHCTSSYRSYDTPSNNNRSYGFRLACSAGL
jgi:hypothetical protein